ncbi:MAG: copper-binding protein [Rubrivivax sp.]
MRRRRLLTLAALLPAAAWAQPAAAADGEVTKIDRAQARVTLKHGEIKALDMPAMTMAWRVADPKLLDGLAVGDRVRFTADKINGSYTVTSLSKAP